MSYFDDGITLFEACREHKFEGIVAKQKKSTYQCGSRSKSWQKIKYTQRDQFVILGYREEEGYLVGHAGRAVGYVLYGFTNTDRKLLAEKLVVKTEGLFKGKKNIVYEPTVMVEIEFMEWTGRKPLRAPVFRGITRD